MNRSQIITLWCNDKEDQIQFELTNVLSVGNCTDKRLCNIQCAIPFIFCVLLAQRTASLDPLCE